MRVDIGYLLVAVTAGFLTLAVAPLLPPLSHAIPYSSAWAGFSLVIAAIGILLNARRDD